jgi:hypothetical protein
MVVFSIMFMQGPKGNTTSISFRHLHRSREHLVWSSWGLAEKKAPVNPLPQKPDVHAHSHYLYHSPSPTSVSSSSTSARLSDLRHRRDTF